MRMSDVRVLLPVVGLVFGLMVTPAMAQADKGKEVYAANKCQMCHMIDGVGSKRAPLDGVGSKLSKDDIRKWIVSPSEMNAKVKKPSFAKIAAADLDALVDYLATLKK